MENMQLRDIIALVGLLGTGGGILVGVGVIIQQVKSLATEQAAHGTQLAEMDRYMRNGLSTRTLEAHQFAEDSRRTADLAIGIARKAEDRIGALLGEMKSIRAVCDERHHHGGQTSRITP